MSHGSASNLWEREEKILDMGEVHDELISAVEQVGRFRENLARSADNLLIRRGRSAVNPARSGLDL
jgi:hypothetical protein